jgi:hypothetical protein
MTAKNHLNNHVRALVINSGNANAGTGVAGSNKGLDNAYQVCEMVAQSLDATINDQSTHMIIKMVFCYHHRRSAKNILGKYCRCCGFRHKRDNRQIQLLSIFNL